jgi:hypothetical protein
VVTIQQSENVTSVIRDSLGVYTVNFTNAMANSQNCYQISQNSAGFQYPSTETTNSVVVNFTTSTGALGDPGTASVVVYGAS